MTFEHIKEGDMVTRMLAGSIEMKLRVTTVDDVLIHCGPWTFDRLTGIEIDDVIETQVSHLKDERYPISAAIGVPTPSKDEWHA